MVNRIKDIEVTEVLTACDGVEAMELIESHPVDILLTDICMSEMSGIDLIYASQQAAHKPWVIVISGYGDYKYVRESFNAGAFDYLLKPVDISELSFKIQKIAGRIQSGGDAPPVSNVIVAKMLEYVANNIENSPNLHEVASQVNYEYSYLSRLFKKSTGISFSEYVKNKKMEYAISMLKEPGIRISELSEKLGYSNPGNFSRVFKKYTGHWPTEYQ